jgi:hypothetical protein
MIQTDDLLDLLDECRLQLEYLNGKFGETGTSNALLSRINSQLKESDKYRLDVMKRNMPDLTTRPDWLSVFEEQEIVAVFDSGNKLRAVKNLLDIARDRGVVSENGTDADSYGLLWCKLYLDKYR